EADGALAGEHAQAVVGLGVGEGGGRAAVRGGGGDGVEVGPVGDLGLAGGFEFEEGGGVAGGGGEGDAGGLGAAGGEEDFPVGLLPVGFVGDHFGAEERHQGAAGEGVGVVAGESGGVLISGKDFAVGVEEEHRTRRNRG